MNVLIATGLYAPDIGGPATYTHMLERHLPAQGINLTVLPFGAVRGYPKVIRHIVYGWQVWRAAGTVDMVYALDPISVGVPAYLAAKLRRKKFLLRLGGDYAWEQGRVRFGVTNTLDEYTAAPQRAPLPVRVLAWMQARVARGALVVVAPSEYLKRVIVTWGVAPDRVQVIYSSLVPIEQTLDEDSVRQELDIAGPLLVSAGRLVPWKGMRVLIDTVAALRTTFPEIVLIIVGDGPQEATLRALVDKYQLHSHVRFSGRANKTELANLINAADVFVLNTAYEGLSHQLLEVMSLGTPIVTTTAGGNTELLTNGVDAFLVPFNQSNELQTAIAKILTNPGTVKRLTQFARARSREFTEERVIADLVDLLHTVHAT